MSTQSTTRTVAGAIDGPEHYGSTVAAAGGFAFIGATAMDATGALAAAAVPAEPYATSAAAQAQAQAAQIFSGLEGSLAEVGSSVGDILQVEQYVERKVHADPYFKIATSKKYLGAAVPVAATAQVGEYHPQGAVVSVTGLAIVPDEGSGFVKSSPDEVGPSTANRKFSEIVVAGPYAFTTLFPSDRKSGLPELARTPEWIWSGSEIGAETKWGLGELENRLTAVGSSFADVVDYTLFLTDASDLFEWDEALKAAVGDAAPSRTVIPSRGYALPRREGAFGHADGAPRMEVQLRIRRPEAGVDKIVVPGPGEGVGYQSAGVQLGSLLWLSSQYADAAQRTGGIDAEIENILDKLAEVSSNGGTSLDQALRIRAQFRRAEDVKALAGALRKRFPSAPPAVTVLVVPSDFPVPAARVAIDAVVAMVRSDRLYIGGAWVTPSGSETIDIVNPTTEEVIGSVPMAGAADADRAVRAAAAALPTWRMSTIAERTRLLRGLAAGLRARHDELAALITDEVGSPLGFSRDQQVGLPINVVEAMADLLPEIPWVERAGTAEVVREPVGVVLAITPWNYPLHQAVLKVAAALAAGCTVILKPSEVAPLSAFVLAEVLDGLGLPPGAFNLVTGSGPVAGEALAAHPMVDMISLTGSSRAGQRIMELAAPAIKKVALELGGKSATVVLDDADIAKVVPSAVAQVFRNTGQNCSALSRLIVPRDRLAEVERIATEVAESWSVGDPYDAETQMGPLVTSEHRDRVLGMVTAAVDGGARLLAGGIERPDGLSRGYFVRPTVFSAVDVDSELAQEEVFGPVVAIFPADDTDDAVRIANSTRYGLSGAVWSADPARARDVALRMRTGRVAINGGPFSVSAPFGGRGQSGVGAEFGKYGIEEFLVLKTLQI